MESMEQSAFLSYARNDTEFALTLARKLRERGINLWVDQWDILPGSNWDAAIDTALYSSKQFVIILSPDSVSSNEVRSELRLALNEQKAIIPVLLKECRIPRQLLNIQYIDLSKKNIDDERNIEQVISFFTDSSTASNIEEIGSFEEDINKRVEKSIDLSKSKTVVDNNEVLERYLRVVSWRGFMGLNNTTGTFTVYRNRFQYSSDRRSFTMHFERVKDVVFKGVSLNIWVYGYEGLYHRFDPIAFTGHPKIKRMYPGKDYIEIQVAVAEHLKQHVTRFNQETG
ncbi:MAG: toll/interleukin-1 receptor domain-containing protein [Cyanobacteria bacterium P01_F01_bin.53]